MVFIVTLILTLSHCFAIAEFASKKLKECVVRECRKFKGLQRVQLSVHAHIFFLMHPRKFTSDESTQCELWNII